jgi:hypothetical protein
LLAKAIGEATILPGTIKMTARVFKRPASAKMEEAVDTAQEKKPMKAVQEKRSKKQSDRDGSGL